MQLTSFSKNLLFSIPFTILTIVPFVLLAQSANKSLELPLIALGALGWWIALVLRAPVMLLARKLPEAIGQRAVILASGPAEEIVRLVILLIIGLTVENGYLIGLGWAGIEVIYALVQGFAMATLEQKTDTKAMEAKAMLQSMGMDKVMSPAAPWWGVLERISANALHLSFTLLLVVNPFAILLTAPLHSGMNYLLTRLVKTSMAKAELMLLGASLIVLFITLQLI